MGDREEGKRRRLEGVIPELIKRAVEVGVEKAQDAPGNIKALIHDLKLPKEIATYILSQVDETKNGIFRVVAKELRDFLEHTNLAGEMQKLLTTVQFEVNTTIRFRPNEPNNAASDESAGDADKRAAGTISKPEVKTQVHVTRAQERRRERRRSQRIGQNTGGGGGTSGGGSTGGGEA